MSISGIDERYLPIYRYCLLGLTLEEIQDKVLFSVSNMKKEDDGLTIDEVNAEYNRFFEELYCERIHKKFKECAKRKKEFDKSKEKKF